MTKKTATEPKHHWELYKPDQRYYLRCEDHHEVIEISFKLRQLIGDRETVYRGLAYTSARAGHEGEEISDDTRHYVYEQLRKLDEAIAAEIKTLTEKYDTRTLY